MRKSQEERVRLIAARRGLKLIKNQYSLAAGGRYILRPIWDAKQVLGVTQDGKLVLVATNRGDLTRDDFATWLPLAAIEVVLMYWDRWVSRTEINSPSPGPRRFAQSIDEVRLKRSKIDNYGVNSVSLHKANRA
jgi:hypothetical protein